MLRLLQILLFTLICANTTLANNVCQLEPVNLSSTVEKNGTDIVKRGEYQIRFLGARKMGNADRPIWIDGIEVSKEGRATCTSPIGIIENPIALAGKKHLYVSTYSGSDQTMYVLNLDNCNVDWKSAYYRSSNTRLFKNDIQLGRKKIRIKDNCLPDVKSAPVGREDEPGRS